jgi:hypothetical protein
VIKIASSAKYRLAAFAVVLAALSLAACDLPWLQPTGPTIIITNTNTATVGQQPAPGTSPSPGVTGCPTPQSVSLGGCPQGVSVGSSCDLSLTPFLAAGVPSPTTCDDARKVEWISTVPCSVITAGSNKYTPALRGVSPGVCKVHALVDSVQSDVIEVEVRPIK